MAKDLGFVVIENFGTAWYEVVQDGASYPDNNRTKFFSTESDCINYIQNLND